MREVCGVCIKTLKITDKRITCVICKNNVHIRCNLLTIENFKHIGVNGEDHICINCTDDNIPFSKLSENEFCLLNEFGITRVNEESDQINFFTSAQNAHLQNINDILQRSSEDDDDYLAPPKLNCHYFKTNEFTKLIAETRSQFFI